jgi:Tol biopolymer transport system component
LFAGTGAAGEPALLFLAAGRCEAMRIPVSGGAPVSLTKSIPPDCRSAELSPDGQLLAYVSIPDSNILQLVNVDGSWKHMLTKLAANTGEGRTIGSLEWSPDGRQIAYTASAFTKDSSGKIQVHPTAGFLYTVGLSNGYSKQLKALGIDLLLSRRLSWSPDGVWIFSFDMGNPLKTDSYPYAFRVSDSRTVWVAQEDPYLGHYDWSPDSLYLSSLSASKPATSALPVDAPLDQNYIILSGLYETKHFIPLKDAGFDPVFGARWFPDRSAFLVFRATTSSLASVTLEGTIRKSIAALPAAPSFVSWSPDGQWIAIVVPESADGAGGTLMVVRPDGTDFRILARGVGDAPPVWD